MILIFSKSCNAWVSFVINQRIQRFSFQSQNLSFVISSNCNCFYPCFKWNFSSVMIWWTCSYQSIWKVSRWPLNKWRNKFCEKLSQILNSLDNLRPGVTLDTDYHSGRGQVQRLDGLFRHIFCCDLCRSEKKSFQVPKNHLLLHNFFTRLSTSWKGFYNSHFKTVPKHSEIVVRRFAQLIVRVGKKIFFLMSTNI